MGITNLFRPKYRHSDPAVRAEAVRELDQDDAEVLHSIARDDGDSAVRCAAIERIADPEALVDISASEQDARARDLARERAAQLWLTQALASADGDYTHGVIEKLAEIGQQRALAELAQRAVSADTRREAVGQLTEPKVLAELARSDAEAELRLAAIDRLDDDDALRSIAVQEQNKQVGFAAVDRLENAAVLESVANKGKNKAVRARARKKLARFDPVDAAPSEAKQRRAERVQLCRAVEALAKRHEWQESYRSLQEAERAWSTLGTASDEALQSRFERACERYRTRRERYGRTSSSEAQPAAAPRPVEPPQEEPAAQPPASQDAAPPAQEEAVAEPTESRPEADESGDKPAQSKPRAADKLAALDKLCASLEGAAKNAKLRSAERKLQQVHSSYKALSPLPSGAEAAGLAKRYDEARHQLFIRVQELREADEWERWANVPRREALVAKAEALLASDDDKNRAAQLKDLQAEWKNVGPVPQKKGQELWDKFKETCDKVYERVKEHRSAMAGEHQANLERKRELCERVEALAESTDWDETADQIKRLQTEWKAIGPVPRKHSNAIWKRFRASCDHFFERRKPHLEHALEEQVENLEKKEALCKKAEQLAEAEESEETAAELRQLQDQWRRIGHVPRKDVAAIGKRFRAGCDGFFQKRQDRRDQKRLEHEQKLDGIKQRIEEVASSAGTAGDAGDAGAAGAAADEQAPSAADLVKQTLELRTEVMGLAGRGEKERELRTALVDLCRQMIETCPDEFRGSELDPDVNRKRKEKLCARAEALVPDEPAAPAGEPTPEQVAARLREALSNNALGGVLAKQESADAAETIADLRDSWHRLGPVPGPDGVDLEERFERACQRSLASD